MHDILRDMKKFTSKAIIKAIEENPQESRKEWLLWFFERAGKKNSNNSKYQFWQQNNKPIELSTNEMIELKLNYIHNNPVAEGIVFEPHEYKYGSAVDYSGGKGFVDIEMV
jgi:putative transposase